MKKVIYTSLVGNYDTLKEPKYIMRGWDYICFSNDWIAPKKSVWEVKPIPYNTKDKLRLSRYAKLNPHKLLQEYDYSLWMDSNIVITSFLFEERINELIHNQIKIAIPKHFLRNCIYQEAQACIREGRERKSIIQQQIEYLKTNNFPKDQGLFENNIILRKHNNKEIISLGEEWWNLYLQFSKRDQLSLVYLFWKNNITCHELLPEGNCARNFEGLEYTQHNSNIFKKYREKFIRIINRI